MAQKYRKIDPRMWDDEKFRGMSAGEKLTAVYIITAQSNRCGLFVYSHPLAMDHLGIEADKYRKAFDNALKTLGWEYDAAGRVIYVPTWWKYNPPENPKHLRGCLEDIHDLPKTNLLKSFRANTLYVPEWDSQPRKAFGKLVDSYAIAMPYQEQKQEREQKQEQERASAHVAEVGDDGKPITSETVYRAYPKHVEPEPSRKSITEAVRYLRKSRGISTPWAWLLGKVHQYADARSELERKHPGANQFIPACHRWVKRKRYEEDPETWAAEVPGFARERVNGFHRPGVDMGPRRQVQDVKYAS